ncbi:MAG: hypothetical protein WC662_03385 [Candidatus Paceibacterota bacterium]|jgi:hypothetical protein
MKKILIKKNREEMSEADNVLIDFGREKISKIKPRTELLIKILDKTETENVTNTQVIRNSIIEEGRVFKNPFINLVKNMNKITKILLSGGVVVVALVLIVISTNRSDDKDQIALNETTNTQVMIEGEPIDVDSLVTELSAIDTAYEEPMVEDGDLLAELINSNDYEIQ